MDLLLESAEKAGLTGRHERLITLFLDSCPTVEVEGEECFRLDVLQGMVGNFIRAVREQDPDWLLNERGFKPGGIVDVQEFCESKEYMVQKGFIRPIVLQCLQDFLESEEYYLEVVLSGAIGWGKDYTADMWEAYQLYVLSRMKNPQIEYDLAPGSSIIYIQQSLTATLARKVCFDQFAARISLSPYFKQYFMFDTTVKSELRFPNNITIMPIGGSDTNAIGLNVFGGRITEVNFMKRITGSVLTKYTGKDEYDQAEELYKMLRRRMKSRYHDKGKCPGKLLLLSSVKYPGDFTDRKIEEARKEKENTGSTTVFVRKHSLWEALSGERSFNQFFRVEVGNKFKRTRVLKDGEEAYNPEDVIEVPLEYLEEFRTDPDGACADFAGVATSVKGAFIPYRELIWEAAAKHEQLCGGRQLFRRGSVIFQELFGRTAAPDWELLIDHDYINEVLLDETTQFTMHIDPAKSVDAAGIAVSHIIGYQERGARPDRVAQNSRIEDAIEEAEEKALQDEVPQYQVDGVLQVKAFPGDEIDFDRLEELGIYLLTLLNIRWITSDQFQSAQMLQALRRQRNERGRVNASLLSVDSNPFAYYELRDSIFQERIIYPNHPILIEEISSLQRDAEKDKIDHPPDGSKDLSDAVTGSIWCLRRKFSRTAGRRRGRQFGTDEAVERARPHAVGIRRIRMSRRRV